jgi:DeoR/GlpR family transcriptional regulator of sugar metabolism
VARSVEEALHHPEVDAVLVVTSSDTHVDCILQGVRAGKAVMCEKPLAPSLVFVITCSVPAALELSSGGYDILLLGGIVRNKSLALLGRETLTILERYRADKAFLGSSGFTAKWGHSTPNPDDAQIKEAIMRAADETYVLVDSSKYGHDCLTSFARLRDVDLTITDSHLSRSKAAILEAAGARLCVVDVAKTDLDREAAGPPAEQTHSRDKAKP